MIRLPGFKILLCVLLLQPFLTKGQESVSILENDYFFPDGIDHFNSEMYATALHHFESGAIADPVIRNTALSSYMIDESRSIHLLKESIARTTDHRISNRLLLTLADYYFINKDFPTARGYYLEADPSLLDRAEMEALNFRLGYSYITEKRFDEALVYFTKTKEYEGDYFIDSWYYSGISEYYLNQKEKAVHSFEYVQNSKRYRHLAPYYLAQIHFKEGNYDLAIQYAERKLNSGELSDETLILKILGLSYLAKSDYDNALKYLDAYAKKAGKLTENEFYQIAITHYNLNQFDQAEPFFLELSHQTSPIGQVSNYLLGSIYLNKGELKNAQSAFKQAFKFAHFPDIQQESRFLYYKISADLGDERVAMSGLSQFETDHPHYEEAIDLLGDLLERTEDYTVALNIIEDMEGKNPRIVSIYKSLSLHYATQLLEEGQNEKAIDYLMMSKQTAGSSELSAVSNFWLAYALDKTGKAKESGDYLDEYLDSNHKKYRFEAHYLKAYQDIQKTDYSEAKGALEKAIAEYEIGPDDKKLFDDAVVRLADLELLNNNYDNAIAYYDLAIENDVAEADYILYQKSLIYGVKGDLLDKLTHLETLIRKYKSSDYRDDALFEIGETLLALKKNNEAYQLYSSLAKEFGKDSPYTAVSYMRLGLISYNQGDMNSALEYYKKGMELTEDGEQKRQALMAIEEIYVNELQDPEAYFSYSENEAGFKLQDYKKDSLAYKVAFENFKAQDYKKAIQEFKDYAASYPNGYYKADVLYYQGESYVLLKEYKDALYSYEQLLKIPDNKYYEKALKKSALIAFNSLKDFEKANLFFTQWIGRSEKVDLSVYESALYAAYVTGHNEQILEYAEKVIAHPETKPDSKAMAHFYAAGVYDRTGQKDKAIENYSRTIDLADNSEAAEAGFRISKILFDQDKLESAELKAFETTKKASNHPFWVAKSLILIGDIYTLRKDYLNASAAYEAVLENFGENPEINEEAKTKLDKLNKAIREDSRILEDPDNTLIQNDSIK